MGEKIMSGLVIAVIVCLFLLSFVWFFDRRSDCHANGGEWVQGWPTWTCVNDD